MSPTTRNRLSQPRRHASYRLTLVAASALFVVASMPVQAGVKGLSALPSGARDITSTALAAKLTSDVRERSAAVATASNLRVIEDDAGYTVAASDTQFEPVQTTLSDGTSATVAMPVTAAQPPATTGFFGTISKRGRRRAGMVVPDGELLQPD